MIDELENTYDTIYVSECIRDVYRHALSEKPVADASALCKQPMPSRASAQLVMSLKI